MYLRALTATVPATNHAWEQEHFAPLSAGGRLPTSAESLPVEIQNLPETVSRAFEGDGLSRTFYSAIKQFSK